jgi:thiamine biosynthesis lipoprotein ApbE
MSLQRATGIASASWAALGSTVVQRTTDPTTVSSARAHVQHELANIDLACSRFRADSELARVNAGAGRSVQVGQLLREALEIALHAAALTDGDVDPTVGRALELAGYDRDWRLLAPPCGQPASRAITVRARSGWRAVELDSRASTIRTPPGVRLDLGATAKAWAADRAAVAASTATGCGVLVSLGGDIATAGPAPPGGWHIRVTDDHRSEPSAPGQTVSISSGGLATSSTAVRRWRHLGRTMHHLIDPGTGIPASTPWRTVSVAAADCVQANIASTAAMLRAESAPGWLAGLGLPARLQACDGRVISTGDWPADVTEINVRSGSARVPAS